jgi:hypothetical protein
MAEPNEIARRVREEVEQLREGVFSPQDRAAVESVVAELAAAAAGYEKGRAAGRDEALREVVAWIRAQPACGTIAVYENQMADAIEAAFPTTGDTDV